MHKKGNPILLSFLLATAFSLIFIVIQLFASSLASLPIPLTLGSLIAALILYFPLTFTFILGAVILLPGNDYLFAGSTALATLFVYFILTAASGLVLLGIAAFSFLFVLVFDQKVWPSFARGAS